MAGLGPGVSAPWGFSVYSNVNGPVNYAVTTRKISSAYTTAVFYGDLLEEDGSHAGYAAQWTTGTAVGVMLGCYYLSTSQKKFIWNNYYPGSDAAGDVTITICNDPMAQFLVQAGSSNLGFAVIGQYTFPNASPTGNTTTGISGMFVSTTTTTPTTNTPFVVVAIPGSETPPNQTSPDPTQPFNWVVVGWNPTGSTVPSYKAA